MQKGQNIHITLGLKIFCFQPEVKGTCISKKLYPGLKFHRGVNFASPTCNVPLKK